MKVGSDRRWFEIGNVVHFVVKVGEEDAEESTVDLRQIFVLTQSRAKGRAKKNTSKYHPKDTQNKRKKAKHEPSERRLSREGGRGI